jgi:Sortase domain
MARYVPKHRKKRKLRDRSRAAALGAFVVASIASLSGSFGFVPGAIADANNPLNSAAEARQEAGGLAAAPAAPSSSLMARPVITAAIDPSTAKQPIYVSIKAIGAASEIVQLGLEPDGSLEVPVDFNAIGWYVGSAQPGEPGAAVFAGHAASHVGPGIFKNLEKLKPDDHVRVARKDGVLLTFVVTRIDTYPKDYFPTEQVYGPTSARELRLITCGGEFVEKLGSYASNVVVYATLVPNVDDSLNR